MAETKLEKITGRFSWVGFPQGEDAYPLYQALGNVFHNLDYDNANKLIVGSSNIGVARIDSELRKANLPIRVANLRDLSRPEVIERVEGRHYTDTPALSFTNLHDDYEPNRTIIQQLIELVEEKNGRVELPLLVTGYDYEFDLGHDVYKARIVARDDFEALQDDRFASENSGKKFTEVDEKGIPFFDRNGAKNFYARKGLSRVCLDGDGGVGSDDDYLSDSDDDGRVVLICFIPRPSGSAGTKA